MARPIDLSPRHEYVLEAERSLPLDQQTTWIFKPLSSVDQILLSDLLRQTPEKDAEPTRYALDYLRRTLVGWRNFPTGKERNELDLPFATSRADGLATNETLGAIPPECIGELLKAGREWQVRLTEDQRGKS